MKNFLRRLKFYGLGFGIGLVFVFFFFRNRGCTWLPENRVKNTILGKVLVIRDDQKSLLKKQGIDESTIIQFLNDGDVDFGASKKQGNPQVYSISREVNGKTTILWFTLPKDGYISEIRLPEGNIQKAGNSKTGLAEMIYFPKVENIVYLDNNPEFATQRLDVGLNEPKQVLSRLKVDGKIDFEKSHLSLSNLPEHYVLFTNNKGKKIEAVTTWYQEHIQFYEFKLNDSIK